MSAKDLKDFGIVVPEGFVWTGEMRFPYVQDVAYVRLDGKLRLVCDGVDDGGPAFILKRAPIWRPFNVAGDVQRLVFNEEIIARPSCTSGDGGRVVGFGWNKAFTTMVVYVLIGGDRARFNACDVEVLVDDSLEIEKLLAAELPPEVAGV